MSQFLYLMKIQSESTGKFLIFCTATSQKEVKKVKQKYYMNEFEVTPYKKVK